MRSSPKRTRRSRQAEATSLKEALGEYARFGDDRPLRQIVALLEQEARDGCPTGSEYLHHLKSAGETRLAALKDKRAAVTPKSSIKSSLQWVLNKIDSDPIGRHSIESMARASGYSRGYFLRSFRVLTGVTPHQYLVQRRLEHASALIRTSPQSIASIALRCGFASDSHLSRVFKRHFGVAPSTFRSRVNTGKRPFG
jgi:AraC family transcriptional regulator